MLTGTNNASQVGWIGAGSGILVYNPEHTSTITSLSEISFSQYLPGAHTDLQGLEAFDVNHTGVLNASDPAWSSFDLWIVVDGVGHMVPLSALGITSISLQSNDVTENVDGNIVFGTSTYTTSNGQTHSVADVGFSILSSGSGIHTCKSSGE